MKKRSQASLTLEAAMALPLYMFFFMSFISMIKMFTQSAGIDAALARSAYDQAVYANALTLTGEDAPPLSTLVSDAYAAAEIKKSVGDVKVSLIRSSVSEGSENIQLIADHSFAPGADFFSLGKTALCSTAYAHCWVGYSDGAAGANDGNERMVYITETGSVYHLSRGCSHLDLTIIAIKNGSQQSYTNSAGSHYSCCPLCGPAATSQSDIFITSDGTAYHSSLSCSGLKRTIYEIPISQVGSRSACKRCGGR